MQRKNIPQIREGTNNTTGEQVKAKVYIFLWILLFAIVMILSIVMYDKDHKIMLTLVPIATAFPCAAKVNKNLRKLQEEKDREKIYIRRDAEEPKKKKKKKK